MNNLGYVFCKLNRLKEAEELFREALNLSKANLLPNHPVIGNCMCNLAVVLNKLNRLKESEELSREALNFCR